MKKEQKPIRVVKHRNGRDGHRTETRVFVREIHEHYCTEPKCKFFGRPAAQGVCHTRLGRRVLHDLERRDKRASEGVSEMREIAKAQKFSKDQYINYLERLHHCDSMNEWFTLDELIRLRGENARLRLAAGKYR